MKNVMLMESPEPFKNGNLFTFDGVRKYHRGMTSRFVLLSFVVLLSFFTVNSQPTAPSPGPTVSEKETEVRAEAVKFLRETSSELSNLRSLENRISLASEMAGLMWFHSPTEAEAMYRTVIDDFNRLLTEYDAELQQVSAGFPSSGSARTQIMQGNGEGVALIAQKFYRALNVRKSIVLGMAEQAPELALHFYIESSARITSPEIRAKVENEDVYFESRLVMLLAEKNVAKALELARRSTKKQVNWTHFEMLRSIYKADQEKGAEFASEMAAKIKADSDTPRRMSHTGQILRIGLSNRATQNGVKSKPPMLDEAELRALAESLANDALASNSEIEIGQYVELVGAVLPQRAAQMRTRLTKGARVAALPLVAPSPAVAVAVPEVPVDGARTDNSGKKTAQTEREAFEKSVADLSKKELSAEDRQKVMEQVRKIIVEMPNRSERMAALMMVATQVSVSGDKAVAEDVMKEVAAMLNQQPRHFRDYLEHWMVATAYVSVNPDKSFTMIDDAIFRLNDTLGAFVKVAEFIDVSGEMVNDGELQVGLFGGDMVRSLMRDLGPIRPTLKGLATSDFERTKNLTNRFDRSEVRILARMMILRSVLEKGDPRDKETDAVEFSDQPF